VDCPREAQENSDQNGPVFERSEFRAVPLFSEHRRIRTIVGVAFFWLLFLAKQEKNSLKERNEASRNSEDGWYQFAVR
jgi:hypothetical protein